ncbi:hypothetical protein [Denitratisoma sp. DHT3]|uniref:hypothetical protein n=1 Tax=Denitratisoma sp. DHT3 TaxID=1981880 RepID=UPI0016447D78|nr:hypothetical protein [Denitratisoma sp. DHT3]
MALVAIAFATTAFAGNNAAPLGVEIGAATLDQVQQSIGKRTRLINSGINAYSEGPMLKGDGEGLDIDGLSSITFIFDKTNRLAGVLMTLPKGGMGSENVKRMVGMLGEKYKTVKRNIPFVGDAFARFKQGTSTIDVDAPHMSFTMEVRYLSDDLLAAFNSRSRQENAEKQRKQQSQF